MKLVLVCMFLTMLFLVFAALAGVFQDVVVQYSFPFPLRSYNPFCLEKASKSHSSKTYVAFFEVAGQQGSGLRALSIFQCFLGSLYENFYIVEPYIEESHVRGFSERRDGLKFSTLFDFDKFNMESRKIGYPEMVTRNEFEQFSPNNVIFVKVSDFNNSQIVWWDSSKQENQSCFTNPSIPLNKLKSEYCIVRVVQLPLIYIRDDKSKIARNSGKESRCEIYDFIFNKWLPEDVTLVFDGWNGQLHLPIDEPLHGTDCPSAYVNKIQFKPSKKLIEDAEKYEEEFLGGQNKLAIMLRVERTVVGYLKSKNKKYKTLEDCFQEVLRLRGRRLKEDMNPLVTMDIGRFGSGSFDTNNDYTKNLSRATLMALYDNKWSAYEWEESFTSISNETITDRSYIAALQKTLASRADCLILMGGGNFQALTIEEYLDYHRDNDKRCIKLVCTIRRNKEVQRSIHYNRQ